jgi:8-oxo-dGTP pyrophosphatase MutT (NUDIX family)
MQPVPLSAGVVVVHRSDEGWRLLILRVYRDWDFPKGRVEKGETPLEAARREVKEESDISDLDFTWGEDFRETAPYGRGKVARYYVAETPHQRAALLINPELGRPEHHEYRWVTPEEARRLLPRRVQSILSWALSVIGESPR